MLNNTTAEAGELPDFPERNPAMVFPAILCGISLLVLVGYIIWLMVLCFRGCIRARRLKKEKEKSQQNGGDVTIDIPLGELDPSGRARSTAGGDQEVDGFPIWVSDEDAGGDSEIEGQAPTRRCGQSVNGAPPRPSSSPRFLYLSSARGHHRTNARRSWINPRTSSTPESSLARIRTHSNPRPNASQCSLSRTRTRSDLRSFASELPLPLTLTRSNPKPYRPEQQSQPPLLRIQTTFEHRPSFASYEPYPQPAFSTSENFYRTMGTKNLDISNWLTLDRQYPQYHKIRGQILDKYLEEVLQVSPSARGACAELLDVVVRFLLEKYPEQFDYCRHPENGKFCVFNLTTNEHFYLDPPDHRFKPLEICARLTQDDFNILMQDSTGEHTLKASATLFPAAWRLKKRMNWTVTQLHDAVPHWADKNSGPVEKYFSRLNEKSGMERSAYFIQIAAPAVDLISARSLLIQKPEQMFTDLGGLGILMPNWIIIRRERQTFTRLPQTKAVCFTVRTTLARLTELKKEEFKGLATEVRAWPQDVAHYRRADIWGDVVLRYCDERCASMVHTPGE